MPDYTPDQIARAHRWMDALPSYQFDLVWLLIRERESAAIAATEAHVTERAIKLAYVHADMNAGSDDDFILGAENCAIAIATDLENKEHLRESGA